MAITPDTDIKLITVPIELDNFNQLTFNNVTDQFNYFNNLPGIEIENATYQRRDSVILFPAHIDSIIHYNYVIYKNTNYTNKQYYAFITNMRYLSDNVTEITIKTDVFQTYQFDIVYKKSFIEREHVTDDVVGKHTIPENVQTGDYITTNVQYDNTLSQCGIVLGSTTSPIDGTENTGIYNGIPSGVGYYGYALDEIDILQENLQYLTDNGKQSGVTGIFLAPTLLMNETTHGDLISNYNLPREYSITLTPITSLNGYTPRNKKLLIYPYCYTAVYNGNGGSVILQPELWQAYNSQSFTVIATLTPGCSIIGVPESYAGELSVANMYTLTGGKYPILNYSADLYVNWQTENGLNRALGIIDAVQNFGSAIQGGLQKRIEVDEIVSGATSIASVLFNDKMADRIPPQVQGNINCGDVNYSYGNTTFTFHKRTIKHEYAEIIDNYFDMYGYKVNISKIPNIKTRLNWNYIRTIDINIVGNIPQVHIEELKSMFNKGVTFWHNPNTFLDYSQPNGNR